MKLTNKFFEKYIGGDFGLKNFGEDHYFQGPIRSVECEDGTFSLQFNWAAELVDGRWVAIDQKEYSVPTEIITAVTEQDGRIVLDVCLTEEVGMLVLPDSSKKLNPAEVEGLKLD